MRFFALLPLLFFSSLPDIFLHTYKTNEAQSTMSISGTSTLHDWEITAESFTGELNIDRFTDSIDIKNLNLAIPVKSLKSGKSAMDRNTYKALKSETHKTIEYTLIRVTKQERVSADELQLHTLGTLTVAGQGETLNIPLRAKLSKAGVSFSGSTELNMTQFGVEPPSFIFGTVSTGDRITIQFNINYNLNAQK